MSTTKIIVAILSSSVLSAFLTKVFDFWSNSISYKRDYYKKIIDNRLLAYEKLREILYQTTLNIISEDGKSFNSVFSDRKEHATFMLSLIEVNKQALWFSDTTQKHIAALIAGTTLSSANVPLSEVDDNQLRKIGQDKFDDYCELIGMLQKSIALDLFKLHDVKDFLRNKLKK